MLQNDRQLRVALQRLASPPGPEHDQAVEELRKALRSLSASAGYSPEQIAAAHVVGVPAYEGWTALSIGQWRMQESTAG